jgi:tetratricopeptide (TPR) repeat protein
MDRNAFAQQVERIRDSHSFAGKNQLQKLLEILATYYDTQSTLKPDRVMRELWPDDGERTSADLAVARNRLRKALANYYREEGSEDEVVIWLPRRGGEEAAEDRMHAWIAAERRSEAGKAGDKGTRERGNEENATYERDAWAIHADVTQAPDLRVRSRGWIKWAGGAALVAVAVAAILLTRHGGILPFVHAGSGVSGLYRRNPPAEAQRQYLRGRYFWNLRTGDGLAKAIDAYSQAIAIDPAYADAYAGLAESYDLLPQFGHADLGDSFTRAKLAADRAIALNPNLAAAHCAKGFALFFWDKDVSGSEAEFQRALTLDPDSAQTHHWYASTLLSRGDGRDSMREIDVARRLNPVSPAIATDAALIHAQFDDFDAGVSALKEIEQTQPRLATPAVFLSGLYFGRGEYANYVAEAGRYASITHDPDDEKLATEVARGWSEGGRTGLLRARAAVLEEQYQHGVEKGCNLGETWLLLGNAQRALPYFKRNFDNSCLLLTSFQLCGWQDALAGSPGYAELFSAVRQRFAEWGSSLATCPNGVPRAK